MPWDVISDPTDANDAVDARRVGQTFTAGDLRLVNRIDVRVKQIGKGALRLTLYDSPAKTSTLALRHLGPSEAAADNGWVSFHMPPTEPNWGTTYYFEIEQISNHGHSSGHAFAISRGDAYQGGSPYIDGVEDRGSNLVFRVGLNMEHERDRSLIIQWRRDVIDVLTNVDEQLADADICRDVSGQGERAIGSWKVRGCVSPRDGSRFATVPDPLPINW